MFGISELDDAVCQQLRRNDLAQCAQVCRKWHEMVIPYLWRDLSWLEMYGTSKQRKAFGRMVLEDYLHEQQRRALEECRGLEPQAPEQTSPFLLSTLPKYGRWVQVSPSPRVLKGYLLSPSGMTPSDQGPSGNDLIRHLFQHCPDMRLSYFVLTIVDSDPDDLVRVTKEVLLPRARCVIAESYRYPQSYKELVHRLNHCSDNLEELSIHMNMSVEDDIEEPELEPKPWKNLRKLNMQWFHKQYFSETFCPWLWKRCGQAETLVVQSADAFTKDIVEVMTKHMPNLNRIDLSKGFFGDAGEDIAPLLDGSHARWKEVALQGLRRFEEHTKRALAKHFHTLEVLVVEDCDGWTSYDLLQVFTSCPHLRELVNIELEPKVSPHRMDAKVFIDQDNCTGSLKAWPCEATLKKLDITISGIPEPDSEQGLETQSQVYERLARFTNLEILGLSATLYYDEYDGEQDMIGSDCLQMSLESGLEKLAGLKLLKELNVSRLRSKIGVKEVQWMVKHWPRLCVIQGLQRDVARAEKPEEKEASEWLRKHCPWIVLVD